MSAQDGRAPTAEEVGMLDRVLGAMVLGGVAREEIEDAVRTGIEMWEAAEPSEDYMKLLRGEITAEEWARRTKAEVKRRLRKWRRG